MVWAAAGDADFGTGDVVIARVYRRIEDYASETWRQSLSAWPICRFRLRLPGVRELGFSCRAQSDATICNKKMKCSMFRFSFERANICAGVMIDVAAALQR
jgi:hypothetical protein